MKKGDKVWMIADWDHKGTFYYAPYIIHSYGKRQVHLVSDDGRFLKERLYRLNSQYPALQQPKAAENILFDRSIDPVAKALELATAFLPRQKAEYERLIAHYNKGEQDSYTKAMRKEIAALHEPRAEEFKR